MVSGRLSGLILCITAVVTVILTACNKVYNPDEVIIKSATTITRIKAGNTIRFSIKALNPKLLKSKKVEISLENAIRDTVSDKYLAAAKVETKPVISGEQLILDVVTTEEFRQGFWHITQLRCLQPGTGKWITYKEGVDFAGQAFHILNFTELPKKGSILEFNSIEMLTQ